MNWLRDLLERIFEFFFPPKEHVSPAVSGGSDDYENPPIANAGSWLPYLSQPYRTQWAGAFDEDNCATRSAVEALEAILNYYLKNNLFPQNLADFLKEKFCNSQGYIKLSIRYNATLNHTTRQGVSVDTVFNNFAVYGIVPESIYPDPPGSFTWDGYYSPVPGEVIAFGKQTLTLFKILWTVIQNNDWGVPDTQILQNALLSSPVYFAGAVGTRDGNGIEQWNGDKVYQHARLIYAMEGGVKDVLDSYQYPSYLRQLSANFPTPCSIKLAIKII